MRRFLLSPMLVRIRSLVALLFWLAVMTLYPSTVEAAFKLLKQPKIAYLFVGPRLDGGWSESHDRARVKLESELGLEIEFADNIPEDKAKVLEILERYISDGMNIVIGNSYGFSEAFLEAAAKYPDVAFLNCAGSTNSDNLESFYARTYQGFYVAGILAGAMTKTNKLGILSPMPYSIAVWDQNGFARGVASVNGDAKVHGRFVMSWLDRAAENRLTKEMIAAGVDVVANDTDNQGVVTETENAGKYSVGFELNAQDKAPKGHLASIVFNWDAYLAPSIRKMMDGTWEPSKSGALVGMAENVITLEGIPVNLPDDVRLKVVSAVAAIKSEILTPFDGPIVRQDKTVVIPVGKKLSDDDIWKMDYYVENVVGEIPPLP